MRSTISTFAAAILLLTSNVRAPDPLCPYPSEDLTFFPYPDDCSQYYECYEGEKYLIPCPSDSNWDTTSNSCLAKQLVNCGNRGSGDSPVVAPTQAPSQSVPDEGGSSNDDWAPDPLCPYPSEDLTFFVAEDCAQYWECYEGNKYLITCPTDMNYNPTSKTCETAQFVNCNRQPSDPNNPGETGDDSDDRCFGQSDGTFHPNPNDCSRFYECAEGKAVDEQCGAGTYWNQAILTCDFIYDVNCPN